MTLRLRRTHWRADRRVFLQTIFAGSLVMSVRTSAKQAAPRTVAPALDPEDGAYHVYPGGRIRIQDALDAAARDRVNKTVLVHAGTYRPAARGQALIWLNARHDGITLEAVGDVILTAANPDVADRRSPAFPAIVNHVVYFGDRVSPKTVLRGFTITGANNFTMGSGQHSPIESDDVRKMPFFYTDGGGIKIYARSYPTIEHVTIVDNYSSPCGGGVSVEHLGVMLDTVTFRHCIFRNNRTQTTGAALDLLQGSRATLEHCLFVGNVANLGVDYVGLLTGGEYHPEHGSGAMTVFANSKATVRNCTFTGNWSGVDDDGTGSTYTDSIFWNNTLAGGISPESRYELDITQGGGVRGCFIHGATNDLRGTISRLDNVFDPPDPQFDDRFVPRAAEYAKVGYRPVK